MVVTPAGEVAEYAERIIFVRDGVITSERDGAPEGEANVR